MKRIGLIGNGIWGKKILESLSRIGVDTVVFDLFSKEVELSVLYSKLINNIDEFLSIDVDGYIVASSTSSHTEILHALAPLGKPVFVEKPLTNLFNDISILKSYNLKKVFMMHIWKYHPGVQMLADFAKNGQLGQLLGVKSRRTNWTSPRTDTNSLWNLGIHDLSICESILGEIPKRKMVISEKHNGIIRGATVLMGKNPYYSFEVSNRYPEKNRDIRLFFTDGVATLKDEKVDYISVYRGDDHSNLKSLSENRIAFDNTPPLDIELNEFINYLKGGSKPMCSLEEGFRLIEHLFEIESLANE
ncbi:MAG: Gfo/Idh/MocA family oxidoreductase [Reichenbachiella sp.]|uniref:Gfo/Idh/MocA family protein n=1 Tax=Reichenbachiella sp. TaxID=2184521 RepID=UPI003297B7B5